MKETNKKDYIIIDDTAYETQLTENFLNRKPYKAPDFSQLNAFIPGTIRDVFVKAGDKVKKDDALFVLEAMKMKNFVKSHRKGIIKSVLVQNGDVVMKNQLIIEYDD